MNGPAHYREADNCVRQGCAADERGAQADAMAWLALGQIHATLALAAAYAAGGAIMRLEDRDGRDRSTDTTQVYTLLADQVADTEIRAARRKRDTRRGRPAKGPKGTRQALSKRARRRQPVMLSALWTSIGPSSRPEAHGARINKLYGEDGLYRETTGRSAGRGHSPPGAAH